MNTLKALWNDDCGAVVSIELILVITILGIGMIVGLTTLRNDVVTELADTAQAVANIDQSYSYCGVTGHCSATNGSAFQDSDDFCEVGPGNAGEQCVDISTVNVTGSNGN